jgi:putative transposase
LEALEEALEKYGAPEISNTDQGCQYTSQSWISRLQAAGVRISMNGKGRYLDNIFVERFWRTVKYEDVYLKRYESIRKLKAGLTAYFKYYNENRLHQALGYQTPQQVY